MPLTLSDRGQTYIIQRIGGKPEVRKHLENLGFVVGSSVSVINTIGGSIIVRKHPDVTVTDLPGIYSLSPYTLEEVVARNYLIHERPDGILNIVDGTNLERNLYLTTQLTELGIPVVVAINMMDVVRKKGDKINVDRLSKALGCRVLEISALKGNGVLEAAEAAMEAARRGKTVPMHTFSGAVEHAIAHIEEAAVHDMPEERQRWYAIKIFERDKEVLSRLGLERETLNHIESDIQAAERELDDDAASIITNERYVYIGQLMKLFSDLDQLAEGDVFYVKVLGETMAYQVDLINKVLPYDTTFLGIEEGQDFHAIMMKTGYPRSQMAS